MIRGVGSKTMTLPETVSRRSVLRKGAVASGAVVFGGTTVVGNAVAQDEQVGLASKIEGHGHYAWFPLGPESWGRSTTPYDMQDGESRWLAQLRSDGSVRCLAQNLGTEPPNRNTGFDVHLGRLDAIETVTVTSRTLQTPRTTGPAVLFLGLYLDGNNNAEFFEWEATNGTDSWVGFGGDEEGLFSSAASGEVTIDGDTVFTLAGAETETTLAELQEGTVEGISGETAAALYVGVVNGGEGTDEVVIDDVRVQRS
ncbi:hypothetical protein [Halorussus salinisoli]|uniref:hypothetical protein n=1 Tax=Halorussus salinisoli TaxID=2558242 RepID=UPI0014850529|nr:hypothetical protein [Halorussus salinisoli]